MVSKHTTFTVPTVTGFLHLTLFRRAHPISYINNANKYVIPRTICTTSWMHSLKIQRAMKHDARIRTAVICMYDAAMLECVNGFVYPMTLLVSDKPCTSEVHFYHRALFFFAAGCCRFHTVCIRTHPLGKKRKRRVCFCTRRKPAVIETGQPKFERLVIPSPINLSLITFQEKECNLNHLVLAVLAKLGQIPPTLFNKSLYGNNGKHANPNFT